jgi:hypothetical protein
MQDHEPRRCYMDGIDWQYHLVADPNGALLFPSESAVRVGKKCIADGGGCGVVEVEVRLVRWIEPQDLASVPGIKRRVDC